MSVRVSPDRARRKTNESVIQETGSNGPRRSTKAKQDHTRQNSTSESLSSARAAQVSQSNDHNDKAKHKSRDAHLVGVLPLWADALDEKHRDDGRAVVWLDIDNTLYRKSTQIAELMVERIQAYFRSIGLSDKDAHEMHRRYYKEYGLAIRGLVMHQKIDALDYDAKCDAALPLDDILRPDPSIVQLIRDLDRSKCRIWALTNAYKTHALRVLRLLHLAEYVEGVIYCDYALENFKCKPEPEFYRGAMENVGISDPRKCYFVDDSLLNIRAAKALGWHSCILYSEREEQTKLQKHNNNVPLENGEGSRNFDASVLSTNGNRALDVERIQAEIRRLSSSSRVRLLDIVLDSCLSDDIKAMKRLLDKRISLSRDMINDLPDAILSKIFERLHIRELLRCRRVSKRWNDVSKSSTIWRSHALALTQGDPTPIAEPEHESKWEPLVRGLYFRERNWAKGICQGITLMPGHTGFVTAMKLKGRTTLVTGSYDETIRVWDLPTGTCKKVLKAKAIACLDFLPEGILAAGLYDTGRVMVWNMRNWTLLQTLSGHNRGIRNVAISQEYLVSVGQDKAIVVWDWKNGSKVVRFGQQSNVSLGVSIVDRDKIVAVTVDGIIRTFDLASPKKDMIGQFDIAKLAPELGKRLTGLKDGSHMMQWFAAHRNTITIGSQNLVIHLQWQEHIVKARRVQRPRRDSTASNVSASTTTSTMTDSVSRRRSSYAPNQPASGMAGGTPRRSLARTPSTTPSSMTSTRSPGTRTAQSPRQVLNNGLRTKANEDQRMPTSPTNSVRGTPSRAVKAQPARTIAQPSISTPSRPVSPSSSSSTATPVQAYHDFDFDALRDESDNADATRIAPNLAVAPKVLSIVETSDSAVGCVDAAKRRIVCASRFSSRSGADRRLYTTTFEEEQGKSSSSNVKEPQLRKDHLESGGGGGGVNSPLTAERQMSDDEDDVCTVVPIGGAWQAMAEKLAVPACNPMSLVLDPDHCVVGTNEGLVYSMNFVGATYKTGWVEEAASESDDETSSMTNPMVGGAAVTPTDAQNQDDQGDQVIAELVELRKTWSTLFK